MSLNNPGRARVRDIVARAIAHNYGAWANYRDDGNAVVCEVPSWPRAQEARRALEAAGYTVSEVENDRTIRVTLQPAAADPVEQGSAWYRGIGDQYAKIAANSQYGPTKTANAAEAAKYYGIADRLDTVPSSRD